MPGCDRNEVAKLVEAVAGEMAHKRALGQWFTGRDTWLLPQVVDFIKGSGCRIAYDPFAGRGDMLNQVADKVDGIEEVVGLDIDPGLGWKVNDSLRLVPRIPGAVVVTNPPYLSKSSASRRKIGADFGNRGDLYLLALDRVLDAQDYVVAVVPESFMGSGYDGMGRLASVTVLEDNPSSDTSEPVAVACFGPGESDPGDVPVYVGPGKACTLGEIEAARVEPEGTVPVRFNDPDGWLVVRCADGVGADRPVRFGTVEDFGGDLGRVGGASRVLVRASVDVPPELRRKFVDECNAELGRLRGECGGLWMSPFLGNRADGTRRRRMSFGAARAIVERAYARVVGMP